MSLRISFELEADDLVHLKKLMKQAQDAARACDPKEITDGARKLLAQATGTRLPGFMRERFERLECMVRMLEDGDWNLPAEDRSRVLNTLCYFVQPDDIIPDHIPGLGFLDDAIMIELVARELRHELQAYEDFRHFREMKSATANEGSPSRKSWLEQKRGELMSRMKRRRSSDIAGKKLPLR